MTMNLINAIATAAILASGTCAAADSQDANSLATGVCSACHGVGGNSISPVFPNLAGQQAGYILLQLDAFRTHARSDPNAQAYMWGMASQLTDDTINALAAYYAAQKPGRVPAGDPAVMAEGGKIYNEGIPAQNVPSCASCHGASAEGAGAFPRLSGQHVEYLIAQLEGFQSGLRANAPIMSSVVKSMNSQQMKAAATYAASK
jgi:cytochrome c553